MTPDRPRSLAPILALVFACNGDTTLVPGTTSADPSTSDADATADTPTTGGPGCGNAVLDEGEDCDGAELGGQTCADIDAAKPGGVLACADDCSLDTSGCAPSPGPHVTLNELTSVGVQGGPFIGDAIELVNSGAVAIDLAGWQVSDNDNLPFDGTFVFAAGTDLGPGQFLVLTAEMLPFGLSNNNDETVTLADPNGDPADQISFAGNDARVSYCRVPDGLGPWKKCDRTLGEANLVSTAICGDGTLADDETCEGADVRGVDCPALGYTGGTLSCTAVCTLETGTCIGASAVILNELSSSSDDIELFNSGAMPVDISGWLLTDDIPGPGYDPMQDNLKLIFPPQTVLAAKEYLVVAQGGLPGQHPFGLNAGGDTVTLLRPDLTPVDRITYGPEFAEQSFCRIPDGPGTPWHAECLSSFGAPNLLP